MPIKNIPLKSSELIKYLFFGLGALNAISHFANWHNLTTFSKPALMPLLLYYMMERAGGRIYKYHLLLGASIILCWLGDVSLMWNGNIYFLIGLLCFTLAHGCYVLVYREDVKKTVAGAFRNKPVGTMLYILIIVVVVSIIFPKAGSHAIPILIYSVMLILMSLFAYHRLEYLKGYQQVIFGTFFFILSDTILAVNKFAIPLYKAESLVIITYITAQFMIVDGIIQKDL